MNVIKNLEDVNIRREKEREFENAFNIPKGHIIIDIPRPELLKAEPRINKTDISVIDENVVKRLDDFTPVVKAIRSRIAPDWTIMIVTDEKYRLTVSKKAEEVLFN
jgi:HD superfamily phosphohydrolase